MEHLGIRLCVAPSLYITLLHRKNPFMSVLTRAIGTGALVGILKRAP